MCFGPIVAHMIQSFSEESWAMKEGATEACTWLYFFDGVFRLRTGLVCPVIPYLLRNLDSCLRRNDMGHFFCQLAGVGRSIAFLVEIYYREQRESQKISLFLSFRSETKESLLSFTYERLYIKSLKVILKGIPRSSGWQRYYLVIIGTG